jgi:GNAT superfamily N-acetyltransferase
MVIALNWLAVRPSHRLRGIGSLLMKVGVQRADDLNVECWMEASTMGKPFDTERPNASDEWRKCAHEMTPPPIFAMWRPKRGMWKNADGKDAKMPWALGAA